MGPAPGRREGSRPEVHGLRRLRGPGHRELRGHAGHRRDAEPPRQALGAKRHGEDLRPQPPGRVPHHVSGSRDRRDEERLADHGREHGSALRRVPGRRSLGDRRRSRPRGAAEAVPASDQAAPHQGRHQRRRSGQRHPGAAGRGRDGVRADPASGEGEGPLLRLRAGPAVRATRRSTRSRARRRAGTTCPRCASATEQSEQRTPSNGPAPAGPFAWDDGCQNPRP